MLLGEYCMVEYECRELIVFEVKNSGTKQASRKPR